jgi:glycosyltransferase involved in cell wall biosynthesis
MAAAEPLDILHVLRAPVGGLFRHVVDLARGQSARGHRVGIVADASTGGAQADAVLAELWRELVHGVSRVPMSRQIGPRDVGAVRHVTRRIAETGARVVHGHGAKGGAYARLAGEAALRVYTPHGGSLHYRWASPVGFLYLSLERKLVPRTDLFLFESTYGLGAFKAKIGDPGSRARVVHNGVGASEFAPVTADPAASDLLFIGELRHLKGIDVLIQALALLKDSGHDATLTIVGDGPDRPALEARAQKLGGAVTFAGTLPARQAFARGRLMVVPSRAESLPYVVLEAAAAGLPLIATRVGGIAEIFGPDAGRLVPPGDPAALAEAIGRALREPAEAAVLATRLQVRVHDNFSIGAMTDAVLAAYCEALAAREG